MTREELLNGYKEDVRDFAKECLNFEGELDATFFDNWAEHFTNLAERLHLPLPEGLEEAARFGGMDYVDSIPDGGTDKHPWNDHDVEKAYYDGMLAGAEYQRKQDQSLIELAEDHAMLAGMNKMKEEMMEEWLKDRDGCFWDGVEEGKKVMEKQMMERAVEADVNTYEDLAAGKSWAEFVVEMPTKNLGDKVRVIVIQEEK